MALVRMTEKKLAANRANARLSKGPITPAGKEKVSRSACKHHLYARKHLLPPVWEDRIWARILPLVADIADPIEHQLKTEIAYCGQWSTELTRAMCALEAAHIARCGGDVRRGVANFVARDPLFIQIVRRSRWLGRRLDRALRDLKRYRKILATRRTLPDLAENTDNTPPKTMAAAAGSGGLAHPAGIHTVAPAGLTFEFAGRDTRRPISCLLPSLNGRPAP